jgi:two-component system, OmpR family, phosphate regulon sensor histidine kinase PhoR
MQSPGDRYTGNMTLDNPDIASETDKFRQRLYRSRWLLVATAVVFLILFYRAPPFWLEILIGYCLIFIAAMVIPRDHDSISRMGAVPRRKRLKPGDEMKAICEALGYPAYIFDHTGILRYQNTSGEQAFGSAKSGDPISFKFRKPELVRLIGQALATARRQEMEYHDPSPPGRWFWLSVTPISGDMAGRASNFYLLSFVDFTETKRAEQMRSDFVANASHELRTPLASMRGFIETIKGPAANDPKSASKFLDLMLEQAERMARLIDDLLSLSRIEMKAHLRPQGEVDLAEVLHYVADTFRPLAQKLGVEINLDLPAEALIINAERDELIQVFENLVENACKYGQSGKQIDISAEIQALEESRRQARIDIRDYGPGIAAEHLPRLTERFYRADIESSREKQGTGLGLAIVKHILTRHGTRLSIASKPGEGAVFSVVFPLKQAGSLVEEMKNNN